MLRHDLEEEAEDSFDIFDDHDDDLDLIKDDCNDVRSSSASSEIFSCDSSLVWRGKKRRGKSFIPRIVKNDIRRHYGVMIANVFNSCDENFGKSFFRTFGVPSFSVVLRQLDPIHYTHIPPQILDSTFPQFANNISFDVDEWMNFHVVYTQVLSSAHVFRVKDVRLVTRAMSKRSIIIMSTELKSTRIYDVDPLDVVDSSFIFDPEITTTSPSTVEFTSTSDRSRCFTDPAACEPRSRLRCKLRASMPPANPNSQKPFSTPSTSLLMTSSQEDHDDPPNIHRICDKILRPPLKLLSKPKQTIMVSQMVLVLDANRCIESVIMGDGRLPPDLEDSIEKKAAALSSSSSMRSP